MVEKKENKKRGFRYGLVVALVIGIMFSFTSGLYQVNVEQDDGGSWYVIWEGNLASAAEADPGSGASGILSVYIHNHEGTPATAYQENDSATLEGDSLGFANADDTEVDITDNTAFDVVVRVRGNATHCKDGADWRDSDLRVRWTCAGLSVGADTVMTGVVSVNDSGYDYLYVNFYDDNSGSGFTIAKGQTIEITSIKFEAYF